ncbi:MAG: ABC transporter permease [Bacteroidia bacterium]|nr:ABC transporter permease [Bacteroidia bacterium]
MNIFAFIFEGFRLSVNALLSNKVRTFLTMMGVATGIFAISAILTMVNSMKYSLSENLSSLGNTTLFVHNWPWKDNSEDWFKYFNRPKVSYSDYMKLKNNLKAISGVSYQVSARNQTVKAEGTSVENVEILGVTQDYAILTGKKFQFGRYFSDIEMDAGSPVCVIGQNIALGLFPDNPNCVGKYIRLGGKKAKVIGVLDKLGSGLSFGPSEDDRVLVPYFFTAKNFNLNRRSIDKLIVVKAESYEQLDYVESEIIGLIRANRGMKPAMEDNFSINKQEMLMKQIDTIFQFLEQGGWIITFFSLLIGGFSIFNIMYISVKERTNEIGVQKALGSTRSFILFQFLTEAITTCLLGGLLGLLILFIAVQIADQLVMSMGLNMHIIVSAADVIRAILLSLIIGLVAGVIPSGMAASVDPVVAIRAS